MLLKSFSDMKAIMYKTDPNYGKEIVHMYYTERIRERQGP